MGASQQRQQPRSKEEPGVEKTEKTQHKDVLECGMTRWLSLVRGLKRIPVGSWKSTRHHGDHQQCKPDQEPAKQALQNQLNMQVNTQQA